MPLPDDLLPLLALAQHYGVPTRLLDWSDKPLIAAYFAAKKASKGFLSVWALNLDWIINTAFPDNLPKISVYVVTAPRASNPNLHAQGGVFTTEQLTPRELTKKVTVRSVNAIVKQKWKQLNHNKSVMVHLKLSSQEAGKLLRLLNQEGINAATVFPGYKGVADSLAERERWDIRERSSYWLKA